MTRSLRTAAALGISLVLAAALLSAQVSRDSRNKTIRIQYGKVAKIDAVTMKSDAVPAGAVVGGILGLALSGPKAKDKAAGAAIGAGGGALMGKALEGKNTASAFTITMNDGSTIKVITEQKDLRVDDCVSVEQGDQTNLRRVDAVFCDRGSSVHTDADVQQDQQRDSDVCQSAQQQLLDATTDADMQRAVAKVKALCR